MSTTTTILGLADELRVIADEISYNALDTVTGDTKRGTIVKAIAGNGRFKDNSLWVALGDDKYKHLTGSKGLVTNAERLEGYTEVVFAL
jgi:hypothetical protein